MGGCVVPAVAAVAGSGVHAALGSAPGPVGEAPLAGWCALRGGVGVWLIGPQQE